VGGSDCGYNFKKGEKYIVYGWIQEKAIGTSICSRTKHYDVDEAKEIEKFAKRREPIK
jgi:hypothetical protein